MRFSHNPLVRAVPPGRIVVGNRSPRAPPEPALSTPHHMITKLVQGTLLVAVAGIASSALVAAHQEGPAPTSVAQQGDDGPAVKGDTKKKEAKEDKITVWTLHASGKG